jgi:hypothetical protein
MTIMHTECRLTRDDNGRLWLERDGQRTAVNVRLCFPWSDASRYISLQDEENREVHFVEQVNELDPGSLKALELALAEARFVMEITRIRAVRADYELRVWDVETRQGNRAFQTKLDDWPRPVAGNGFLIRDVAGDLFHIPEPSTLDPESRLHLSAFVD